MPASRVQLVGGSFQDSQGNLLSNGYLTMVLSSDAEVDDSLICSGIALRIQLDASGNVVATPPQAVWGNDQLLPVNTFYKVTGYSERGQVSFGPNNQQVIGSGGTFDVGTWIPNLVIDWVPPLQVPTVEVNGTPTSLQSLINLTNSTSVLFTNPSGGQIVATAVIPPVLPVQVNGTDLLSPSPVDFVDSASVTFANPTAGHIQATAVPPPPPPLSLPQPDVARFSLWIGRNDGSNGFTPVGDGLVNSGGTTTESPDAVMGQFVLISGGINCWNGSNFVWPGRLTTFKSVTRVHVTAGSSSVRCYGITNQAADESPLGTISSPTPDSIVVVVNETTGVFSNWLLYSVIGGAPTIIDSGIPVVSNQRYELGFVLDALGVVTLYINGVAAGHTSTIPTANAMGQIYYQQRSAGFDSVDTDIEYLYTSCATP